MKKSPMRWLFNDYVLDVERRELRCAGALVAIEPQVFDLLVYLIQNRGRVVSRDELLGSVWQGRIVSDSALATASMVRGPPLATTAKIRSLSAPCRGRGFGS